IKDADLRSFLSLLKPWEREALSKSYSNRLRREGLLRLSVSAVCMAGLLGAVPLRGQEGKHLDSTEVRRWSEDLAVLRKEMPAHHANLFHDMTPAQFDSALNSISARLPSLTREDVIVELQK